MVHSKLHTPLRATQYPVRLGVALATASLVPMDVASLGLIARDGARGSAPAGASAPVLYSADPGGPNDLRPDSIVNGQKSKTCGWPATASMTMRGGTAWGRCTGTLIHPKVLISAAHCTPAPTDEFCFGESASTSGRVCVKPVSCKVGPGASDPNGKQDWSYCVLPDDERLKKIPYVPPLHGCEWDKYLKPGVNVWTVGFGLTSRQGGQSGIKYEVEVPVNKVDKSWTDVGKADGTGDCHGDSGGPVYIHLTEGNNDWGWRVFGMTHGPGTIGNTDKCDCTCSTAFASVLDVVTAIEKNENIDVTPCTDSSGQWAPGPDCKSLPADPQNSGGAWPACGNPVTTVPIDSCGGGTTTGAGGAGTGGAGGVGTGGAGGGAAGGTAGRGGAGTGGAGAGAAGTGGRGGAGGSGIGGASSSASSSTATTGSGGGSSTSTSTSSSSTSSSSTGSAGSSSATTGTGGAGGSGPGATTGSSGSAGAGRGSSTGTTGSSTATTSGTGGSSGGDGGCSCQVVGTAGRERSKLAVLGWLVVLGAVVGQRRRRR